MRSEDVRATIKQAPFVPFEIRLADGTMIRVDHPEYAHLPPGHRTMSVYQRKGGVRLVDVALILEIVHDEPRPAGRIREESEEE